VEHQHPQQVVLEAAEVLACLMADCWMQQLLLLQQRKQCQKLLLQSLELLL
jgi:hypothetical protein